MFFCFLSYALLKSCILVKILWMLLVFSSSYFLFH